MSDTSLVASWYNQNATFEHNRLIDTPLEHSVTLRVILDIISQYPAGRTLKIADIGGGTGRYAVELAKLGHRVTLSDISSSELELATEHTKKENVSLENIIQADARDLGSTFSKREEYDIVLLLGPLYHLLEESERINTLESCAAITKPEGFIICSFVTKFAHLRDLAQKDPGRLSREKTFYDQYLLSGKYTRNTTIVSHHTHPVEIQQLFGKIAKSGVEVQRMVGCEGFLGGGISKHLNTLSEEEYDAWVDVIVQTAEDPHILSASDHIVVVAARG